MNMSVLCDIAPYKYKFIDVLEMHIASIMSLTAPMMEAESASERLINTYEKLESII